MLVGLRSGFAARAQIGKGMWAMPDLMPAMLEQKIAHPKPGQHGVGAVADRRDTACAHYHDVDVQAVQRDLEKTLRDDAGGALLEGLLNGPVVAKPAWSAERCAASSTTTRKASRLRRALVDGAWAARKCPTSTTWRHGRSRDAAHLQPAHPMVRHGIVTKAQVQEAFERMAKVVDQQNAGDPFYRPMAPNFERSLAFQAACAWSSRDAKQPSGTPNRCCTSQARIKS